MSHTPSRQDLRQAWVEALESGKFSQTQDALRENGGYCCLGVLCEVYKALTGEGEWVRDADESNQYHDYFVVDANRDWSTLPDPIAEAVGLNLDVQRELAGANDTKVSFQQIASIIKTNEDPTSLGLAALRLREDREIEAEAKFRESNPDSFDEIFL